MYKTDLLIIGAGPVGLFAGFQAGMLKIQTTLIDSLDAIGGQCSMLYPEKPIYDIPAYPMITGGELIQRLHDQMSPFKHETLLNQRVLKIEKKDSEYVVKTDKSEFLAKAIIIATGGGNFTPNRPPLSGIETFEGKSIFYSVNNVTNFKDKVVVIAGGGDSAVDWAINLAGIAKKVYVVHRRDKFRAMQASIDQMHALADSDRIEMVVPYQLHALNSSDGRLQSVDVQNLDGVTKTIECDFLLPFFGIAMDHKELTSWGLNMTHDHRYLLVDQSTMETNLPGIFAIGDICSYPGKLKLILTGFAEGALAVHEAFSRINPEIALHFEHSTTKGLPL
jgi:thioredoxin reductase (NADPH)